MNLQQTKAFQLDLSPHPSTLNLSATIVDRIQSKLPFSKSSIAEPWVYDDEWTSYIAMFVGDDSRPKHAIMHTDATR